MEEELEHINPVLENYSERILEGQRIEKIQERKKLCVDILWYSTWLVFFPCIFTGLCWVFSTIGIFCFPCIIYLSCLHKPKNLPFFLKFGSLLMKVGYFVLGNFPPRWGQILMYFLIDIRVELKKSDVEIVEYNDGLRPKNSKAKLFVYGEDYEEESDEEDTKDPPVLVCMFYLHGGGYLAGHPENLDLYYKRLVKLASERGRIHLKVYALDYRKAPRWKVDSILRQSVEILKHVIKKNPKYKIVLCGDSAGGNLAILLAHYIRDNKYEMIPKDDLHVIPLYPVLLRVEDSEKFKNEGLLASREEYGKCGSLIWNAPMKKFEDLIYGNDPYKGEYNYYDFYTNLDNLPSHFIITAEYDFLRDDGEIYYKKLVENMSKEEESSQEEMISSEQESEGGEEISIEEEEEESSSSSSENSSENQDDSVESEEEEEEGFEYFKYMCFEGECHGFNNNIFHLRKETKGILYNEVLTNIEKKFCR